MTIRRTFHTFPFSLTHSCLANIKHGYSSSVLTIFPTHRHAVAALWPPGAVPLIVAHLLAHYTGNKGPHSVEIYASPGWERYRIKTKRSQIFESSIIGERAYKIEHLPVFHQLQRSQIKSKVALTSTGAFSLTAPNYAKDRKKIWGSLSVSHARPTPVFA